MGAALGEARAALERGERPHGAAAVLGEALVASSHEEVVVAERPHGPRGHPGPPRGGRAAGHQVALGAHGVQHGGAVRHVRRRAPRGGRRLPRLRALGSRRRGRRLGGSACKQPGPPASARPHQRDPPGRRCRACRSRRQPRDLTRLRACAASRRGLAPPPPRRAPIAAATRSHPRRGSAIHLPPSGPAEQRRSGRRQPRWCATRATPESSGLAARTASPPRPRRSDTPGARGSRRQVPAVPKPGECERESRRDWAERRPAGRTRRLSGRGRSTLTRPRSRRRSSLPRSPRRFAILRGGEVSEWLKVPLSKSGVRKHRGFESHPLRHSDPDPTARCAHQPGPRRTARGEVA